MSDIEELISTSSFYEDRYGSTLPRDVRKKLGIRSPKQNLIFIQEPNGEISLAHTGKAVTGIIITTANLSGSVYRFTLPKQIRDILKIGINGKVAYWELNNKKIAIRNVKQYRQT